LKKKSITYEKLEWARNVLGLGHEATLDEIKSAYRNASKRWHPDHRLKENGSDSNKHMQDINQAYQILMEYIKNYRYVLVPDKKENFDPESWWWERFGSTFAGKVKPKKRDDQQ